jgi:phenol hydroxylase P4 protein
MPVVAAKPYSFPPRDTVDKFHGAQLLYIGWDQHLLFCAPLAYCLPPNTRFGDLIEKNFPASFGYHPDFAKIDWSQVQWLKSGQPWQPDVNKTLAENGLKHKDCVRFKTPGLTGIKGSSS